MGSEINLRMGGYLRQRILATSDIFLPVTGETLRTTVDRRYFSIKTDDQESSIRVLKDGARTTALFTYPIDIDGDPKNGRLYLEDRFVFYPHENELIEAGRSFRQGSGKGLAAWEDLLKRLRTRVPDLNSKDAAVKRFFSRVVLQLPDPCPEEAVETPPPPAEKTSPLLSPLVLIRNPPVGILQNLLFEPKEKMEPWAERVDRMVEQFSEQLSSLGMVAALIVGATAFRLGERAVLFQKGIQMRPLFLATGAGLAAEAPAFEIAHRVFHGPYRERDEATELADDVLSNYLTFGILHGAGLGVKLTLARVPEMSLLYGSATFPILHHSVSFASLHGVKEMERLFLSHGENPPWAERLVGDGVFYLQASLASHLTRISGEPFRVLESRFRAPSALEWEARLAAEKARAEELEGQLHRLRVHAEQVLENAEARDRENAILQDSLQAALRRAKEFQDRVGELEGRLKRNKEGTEKVIEWARLKERANDSLRASLEDALRKLEELSAERDRLATDLEEMKTEFVRRDQKAMEAERRVQDLEAQILVLDPPPQHRISTIVLKGPDPEIPDQKEK